MKGPNEYTKPCPDNGVEHDCTHEYLMWWDRDSFDRWLEEHDREIRKKFADELTRKGIYSFNIHQIRDYAGQEN